MAWCLIKHRDNFTVFKFYSNCTPLLGQEDIGLSTEKERRIEQEWEEDIQLEDTCSQNALFLISHMSSVLMFIY
jgi:hypothetical protein